MLTKDRLVTYLLGESDSAFEGVATDLECDRQVVGGEPASVSAGEFIEMS